MKDTKAKIIQKSFSLFLVKNYDIVSLSDIQEIVGISRGGIYHHFKSKEEIFREVIERYLLPILDIFSNVNCNNISLKEAISETSKYRRKCINNIRKNIYKDINDFFYYKLSFQAGVHYHGFMDKIKSMNNLEKNNWEEIALFAIKSGEVQFDLENEFIAESIMMVTNGYGLAGTLNKRLLIDDLESTLLHFYNYIKSN